MFLKYLVDIFLRALLKYIIISSGQKNDRRRYETFSKFSAYEALTSSFLHMFWPQNTLLIPLTLSWCRQSLSMSGDPIALHILLLLMTLRCIELQQRNAAYDAKLNHTSDQQYSYRGLSRTSLINVIASAIESYPDDQSFRGADSNETPCCAGMTRYVCGGVYGGPSLPC